MNREPQTLDDVASSAPAKNLDLSLDEVGLENVQMQVHMNGLLLPARGEACVSLVDKNARGIHMSRLYKVMSKIHEQELSFGWLDACLEEILVSHDGLSDAGRLQMTFDLPVMRKALISQEQGWRNYPVTYRVESKRGKRVVTLITKVLYSSTCPCSAGLSRQAMREKFMQDFKEPNISLEQVSNWLSAPENFVATPHAQRSEAIVEFTLDTTIESLPSTLALIDEIEHALGTPVQASVKREDEQEFAKRNAQNLMFCEDAARKLKSALLKREDVADFKIEVRHFESLHAHDVVAKVRK